MQSRTEPLDHPFQILQLRDRLAVRVPSAIRRGRGADRQVRECLEDLGVVTGLLARLGVGDDGALVVPELVFGDLAEPSPQILRHGRVEDCRRALLEGIGVNGVASRRGSQAIDVGIERRVLGGFGEGTDEHPLRIAWPAERLVEDLRDRLQRGALVRRLALCFRPHLEHVDELVEARSLA